MPKIRCHCGYVHDLSPILDKGFVLVRDADYERLIELETRSLSLEAKGVEDGDAAMREVNALKTLLYECPECGRLAWLRRSGDDLRFYGLEAAIPSEEGDRRARRRIMECLHLGSSLDRQRFHEKVAGSPAAYAILDAWRLYVGDPPRERLAAPTFTDAERAAISAFHPVWKVLANAPRGSFDEEDWMRFRAAAERALAVFRERGTLE